MHAYELSPISSASLMPLDMTCASRPLTINWSSHSPLLGLDSLAREAHGTQGYALDYWFIIKVMMEDTDAAT